MTWNGMRLAGLLLAASTVGALAQSGLAELSCDELWHQRNSAYKDAGYCFKTQAAIRTFGNAGCKFDSIEDVPLSANVRREINAIVATERRKGCPR